MLQEQRLDWICNMMESSDDRILLESVSYSIQDSFDIFDEIFLEYGEDELVIEAGKIKEFISKSKGAISKLMAAASKLASYLGSKIVTKVEKIIHDPKLAKKQIKLPGRKPIEVQKTLDENWKKLLKVMEDFKKTSTYNKMVFPVANVLSYTPPLLPYPGTTEVMLALSSVGDFILDYKRRYLGQQYNAIKNFSDYIQNNMQRLDESVIYESDKIAQKICNFVNTLQDEVKRLTLAIDHQAFKAIEKGSDALDKASDKLGDGKAKDKIGKFAKKSKEASKTAKDESKETLDKFKKYREKKKITRAKIEANNAFKGDKKPAVSPAYMQGKTMARNF